jgi:hypothetical protein
MSDFSITDKRLEFISESFNVNLEHIKTEYTIVSDKYVPH